jgi:hypothetical protein
MPRRGYDATKNPATWREPWRRQYRELCPTCSKRFIAAGTGSSKGGHQNSKAANESAAAFEFQFCESPFFTAQAEPQSPS